MQPITADPTDRHADCVSCDSCWRCTCEATSTYRRELGRFLCDDCYEVGGDEDRPATSRLADCRDTWVAPDSVPVGNGQPIWLCDWCDAPAEWRAVDTWVGGLVTWTTRYCDVHVKTWIPVDGRLLPVGRE